MKPDLDLVEREAVDHFNATQGAPHSNFAMQTDTLSVHASKRFWFSLGARWQAARANAPRETASGATISPKWPKYGAPFDEPIDGPLSMDEGDMAAHLNASVTGAAEPRTVQAGLGEP